QILSLTLFEKTSLNQLVTNAKYNQEGPQMFNQLNLFDEISGHRTVVKIYFIMFTCVMKLGRSCTYRAYYVVSIRQKRQNKQPKPPPIIQFGLPTGQPIQAKQTEHGLTGEIDRNFLYNNKKNG
ncbi:MAG: hypothetical protein ACYCTY_15840, partial [Sulfuricella sp.]